MSTAKIFRMIYPEFVLEIWWICTCRHLYQHGSTRLVDMLSIHGMFRRLPDTSATRHFGIKTLWDTSAPISRHFDTRNVVRDTSTRVPWSRKSRDTSTQDNSDKTQLHRWFGLNFGTNFVVPKCLGAEVSCGRNVRLPFRIVHHNALNHSH